MEQRQSSGADVDRLVEAILAKLKDNKPILAKSLGHGHIQWRKQRNGEFEIDLEPKL